MACDHDAAIRSLLVAELRAQRPGSFIVQEWTIPLLGGEEATGDVRADLALIGDAHLEGFEIKSAADSLARLPRQVLLYSAAFHFCTIVLAEKHLEHALTIVPPWWGVRLVEGARLVVHRPASYNASARPERLLWYRELDRALRRFELFERAMAAQRADEAESRRRWGAACVAHRPYKQAMIRALGAAPPRHAINRFVCRTLRGRRDWRMPDGKLAAFARLRAAGRL